MRQETLKKDACGAQRGQTRYPPSHTRATAHIQTHTEYGIECLPFVSWPELADPNWEPPQCPQFEFVPRPFPSSPAPCSIWFRYVFVLVLSLFKCQLHSTFIQICVARICLDIARHFIIHNKHTQTHTYTNI